MIGMTQVPCRHLKRAVAVEEVAAVEGDAVTAEDGVEDDMIPHRLRHFPMANVGAKMMNTEEVLPIWNKVA